MKKLLFVFSLAFICTVVTSSYNPAMSANEVQILNNAVTLADVGYSAEDVKKEDNKSKQAETGDCCQAKVQNEECTTKQQKKCPATQTECPKKDNCKEN